MSALPAWVSGLSIVLSLAGFCLSIFTFWATQFRRGDLRMTRPTMLCLKRDMPQADPKIFLRTLLFSTATRGRVVEAIFLRVHNSVGTHLFDFWGHTEGGKLTLGSGLFVGQQGVACDHHFNPRRGSEDFYFWPGGYRIEIFATSVMAQRPKRLMEVAFEISDLQAAELGSRMSAELFLVWNSEKQKYEGRVELRPPTND